MIEPGARGRTSPSRVWVLFQVALRDFSRNNGPYIAAGMAYWTVFSIFPLAIAGLSIMGFLFPTASEQRQIVDTIVKVVPVSDAYLAEIVGEVVEARGALSAVAVVGLLFTGTAVFSAIRKGVNHAWGVRQPPYFLIERALDLGMLVGVGVLALLVVVFSTNVLGLATLSQAPGWITDLPGLRILVKLIVEIAGVALTAGVFMLLYRYLPNTSVAWRDVWLGGVLGALLFDLIRIGLAWYVARFSSFQLIYGSLGAIMAVMAWAYLSSLTVVWGAQLSYTYSRVFGSRASSDPLPELRAPVQSAGNVRRERTGAIATVARWLLPPRNG